MSALVRGHHHHDPRADVLRVAGVGDRLGGDLAAGLGDDRDASGRLVDDGLEEAG
jgi:hypothetical protein